MRLTGKLPSLPSAATLILGIAGSEFSESCIPGDAVFWKVDGSFPLTLLERVYLTPPNRRPRSTPDTKRNHKLNQQATNTWEKSLQSQREREVLQVIKAKRENEEEKVEINGCRSAEVSIFDAAFPPRY